MGCVGRGDGVFLSDDDAEPKGFEESKIIAPVSASGMTIPVLVQFNISDSLKISYLARPTNTDRDYLMRSGRVGVLAHRRIKRWASTPILQVHFAHRAITISITQSGKPINLKSAAT